MKFNFDGKLILFVIGAIAFGLLQELEGVPFPDDIAAYVKWILNGVIYGIGAALGIDFLQTLKKPPLDK